MPAIAGLSTSYEADGVSIENNIFYNNGNNNLLRCNTTGWLQYTNQSNILGTNPLFSSSVNFNIQSNSPAIDAGLDVGLTSDYVGNAIQKPPDIGAYEFYTLPLPVYQNAAVENATPSLIGITYNLTLANIVPANASFNVLVNSLTRAITSVAISGTKIQLTLASPVEYGDVVTVSYTKPSINPSQTIAGGESANISAKAVTNNCISNVPVYSAAVVQNITPSLIEITFSLALANIVPSNSAFIVQLNSSARNITSVTISGNKVQLTLGSGVKFGDIITVSYTKPVSNPLQTSSGAQTSSISNQPVTNNCNDAIKTNNPPVVVINYAKTIYEGFVSEIDATSTYDPNNDSLIVEWTVPNNVPVSIVQSFKTEFLAPVVDNSKTVNFDLKVSDGTTILSNAIPVTVLPYKPELNEARITNIIASTYLASDYPEYIIDGNITTKWSSDGDNQWLILTLAGPFRISHLMIAFLQEQNYESYFDIYGSKDNVIWENILTSAASCKFSGERQIFDIPALNSNSEYPYLKYVGHGNSLNSLNSVSEIKIFGTPQQGSKIIDPKGNNITIYPNPTQNFFNISINEPDYNLNSIRIIDISGKIVFEYPFDHKIDNVRLPDSLNSG